MNLVTLGYRIRTFKMKLLLFQLEVLKKRILTLAALKIWSKILGSLIILFFVGNPSYSQEEGIYNIHSNELLADQSAPSLSLFEDRSILDIKIETNIEKLYRHVEDPENQKATLTFFLNDSVKMIKLIDIRVRGHARKELCNVPPLRIDFDRSDFLNDWLGAITSLKLVNTCSDGAEYNSYLHKEYIMLEIYRLLTDVSYRVRLLNLNIIDSKNIADDISAYAFFLENDKKLASRTKLKETELEETTVGDLVRTFYMNAGEETVYNVALLSIYQYMMGNTDWNITGLHNVKLFDRPKSQYLVPYDFDYSGFVNAKYAVPSKSVPIKNIRVRYYQGPCCDPAIFEMALNHILSKKESIYQTIYLYPYIKKKEKEKMIAYLDGFFEEVSDKANFVNKFATTECQE